MDLSHLPWGYTQDDEGPLVVNGRYKLAGPDGRERSWTRVTTLVDTLGTKYAIDHWDKRVIAHGIGMRPDLAERAAVTPVDDKAAWKDIIAAAVEVGGGHARANHGTALHATVAGLLSGAIKWQDVPAVLQEDAAAYFRELERLGLRQVPELTERTILNLDLEAGGTFDIGLVDGSGNLILGDLKTGDKLDFNHTEHAAQLSIYNHAHLMRESDGSMVPAPHFVQSFAVLIHVPYGSGRAFVHRVDTNLGYAAARVASQLRAVRSLASQMLSPYLPDDARVSGSAYVPPAAQSNPVVEGGMLAADAMMETEEGKAIAEYIGDRYGQSQPGNGYKEGGPLEAGDPILSVQPATLPFEEDPRWSEPIEVPRGVATEQEAVDRWYDNGGAVPDDKPVLPPEQVEKVKEIKETLVERGVPEEAVPVIIQHDIVVSPPAGLDEQAQELFDLLPAAKRKAALQELAKKVDPSIKPAQHAIKLARAIVGSAGWVGNIRDATLEELRSDWPLRRKRGRPKKEAAPEPETPADPEPEPPTEEEVSSVLDESVELKAEPTIPPIHDPVKAKEALDRVNSPFVAAAAPEIEQLNAEDQLVRDLMSAPDAATMMGIYFNPASTALHSRRTKKVFYRQWIKFAASQRDIEAAISHGSQAGHVWQQDDIEYGNARYSELEGR